MKSSILSFLLSGRWIIRHILVIVVFIALVNFGFWQLRRLEEKRTRNTNIVAALNAPSTTLSDQKVAPDDFHFRPVTVTGTFDNDEVMIIRNRTLDDVPGVHILTPLKISGSDQTILVDRGWIPRGNLDPSPEERAVYNVSGEVVIEGIAYRTQPRPALISWLAPTTQEGQAPNKAWTRVDIEHIQERIPYSLLPIFVAQISGADPEKNELPRREGGVELDEGPHLGYAVQWFSFAMILLFTYLFFIRQELRKEV